MISTSVCVSRLRAATAFLALGCAALAAEAVGFGHSGGHGAGHSGGGHSAGGHSGGSHTSGGHSAGSPAAGSHTSSGSHAGTTISTGSGVSHPTAASPTGGGHAGATPATPAPIGGSGHSSGHGGGHPPSLATAKAWVAPAQPKHSQADFNVKAMPQPEITKRYQPITQELNAKATPHADSGQRAQGDAAHTSKPKAPPPLTREFYMARDGYPPNQGTVPGEARIAKHEVGEVLGRRGNGWGRFTTPELNPKRGIHSLDPKSERLPMQQYEVLKEFRSIQGPVAPAWSQPGGGRQHLHAERINDLVLNGYLRKAPGGNGGSGSGGSK
jgi:hypothetical protein